MASQPTVDEIEADWKEAYEELLTEYLELRGALVRVKEENAKHGYAGIRAMNIKAILEEVGI